MDAIFAAAQFMDRVWRDIERVSDAVPSRLARDGLEVSYRDEESHDDDYAEQRFAYLYDLRGAYPKQRTNAQLVLYFDLARPGPPSEWIGAQKSLLIVAYDPRFASGWGLTGLAFDTNGIFESPTTRAGIEIDLASGGRLFVWNEEDDSFPWARRSWGFAVPLEVLDGPEAVDEQLIAPIRALIRDNATADVAFAQSEAITWPIQSVGRQSPRR